MSMLINENTRVIVLGITGNSGSLQTKAMLDAGTRIVAGVTPGKGGREVYGVPVFDYIAEAAKEIDFDTAISFVPPSFCKDSCYEAIDAGIRLLVLTTEELPLQDVVEILAYAKAHGTTVVGPGCAGLIAPGKSKVGSHPVRFSGLVEWASYLKAEPFPMRLGKPFPMQASDNLPLPHSAAAPFGALRKRMLWRILLKTRIRM